MEALVSCIIPTFNRAHLLKDAIESTLGQSYPHWELVIVDDGSTDGTADLVKAYQERDSRVRYFRNPRKGGSSARNHGIQVSRGSYIAFLDDDDISLPHRFEAQLRAMESLGSRFLVSGYQVRERSGGRLLVERKLELKAAGAGFPSRWMIRKDLLEQVGGFDEDFPSMQDIELSYRLSEQEVFVMHDDIVSVLYETMNSVSRVKSNTIKGRLLLLERNEGRMPGPEAAYWFFVAGMDLLSLGEKQQAREQFRKAAQRDRRGPYRLGYYYLKAADLFGGGFERVNLKILRTLAELGLPLIIRHPIASASPKHPN